MRALLALAWLWILPASAQELPALPADPTARARALLDREADLLDALDALDGRIAEVALERAELALLRTRRAAALLEVEARLAEARDALSEARATLRVRLRALTRLDPLAWRRVLFSAATPTDYLRRRGLLRAVLRADAALEDRVARQETLLATLRADRTAAVQAVRAAEQALGRQREALEDERAVRHALLGMVRGERRLAEQLAAARRARLDAVPLTVTPDRRAGIAAEKGRLPAPVNGRVVVGFGPVAHPEHGTTTFNGGLIFDAPYGAPVRAVHNGRVVYSGWYKGFGNLVIVDHGDAVHTLYGHLSAIRRARGEDVSAGAVIGAVGDAGSLRGPRLYFELRVSRRPVDPAPWLRSGR